MKRAIITVFFVILTALPAVAQKHAIPPTLTHTRAWVVDTLSTDSHGLTRPSHSAGMLGFVCASHKDGVHVLCEYVAKKSSDLDPIRNAAAAHGDPKVFFLEKHKTKHLQFEAAAHAAGFNDVDLRRLLVAVR